MNERKGDGKSGKRKKPKKKKKKKKKFDSDLDISKTEETVAKVKNLFSAENLRAQLKAIFSIDNIVKYKVYIVLFFLVLLPTIIFFSSVGVRVNKLVKQQSPEAYTSDFTYGEELFTISTYNPIARDINNTNNRQFSYEVQFIQEENTEYLLPTSQYYVEIHDVTCELAFKNNRSSYDWFTTWTYFTEVDQTLAFGEKISGTVDVDYAIFGNYTVQENDSDDWNAWLITITINSTHYYAPEDSDTATIGFQGTVINVADLRSLNMGAANSFGLTVILIYMVIAGLAMVFFLIWLQKKRYSFIQPY
ncbi:MAG: hypothetical protein GF364_15335 [Candidatus Lokiarchaeota archaeon]|nr:hypothetical protein [Candidatus Lokiarchaeota archaeon]